MKKIQIAIFITFCFSYIVLPGQSAVYFGGSAWQTSNGGIVSNPTGINAIYTNPACLSLLESKWGFDLGLERRFNLTELSTYSGGVFYKMHASALGISIVRFGYEDYTEQKIGFTYSRKLFDNFQIGSNFVLLQYLLNEFGNKTLVSFDVGINAEINKKLSIGSVINNPASSRFDQGRDVPVRLAVGTNYKPSKKVNWLLELEKIVNSDFTVKSAIIYKPVPAISLRVGGDLNRNLVGFGVLYNIHGMHILGGYNFNSLLGSFPAISMGYQRD